MAATVFAEPVALASGIVQAADLTIGADPLDPLFSDVEAPQLTELEADAIEGDGVLAAFALGAVGGAIGLMVNCYRYGAVGSYYSAAVADRGWKTGFAIGASVGFLMPGL
jgi:hypothetical protein